VTHFNLRKRDPEPEPEELEEEQPEEAEDEPAEEAPKRVHGPIVTGILGPGQWIAARAGTGPAWGVHGVAVWAIGFYGGWVTVGVTAAWLALVLLFTPRDFKDRISGWLERKIAGRPEPDDPPRDQRLTSDPQEVYAATLQWARSQIGDSNGIHLSALLAHAHAHNMHTDLDVAAFRTVLERWGFPIRQQLKVGGKNRPGIHRDDLPKLPLSAPSPEESGSATTSAGYQI
jgi:hypothetical protein